MMLTPSIQATTKAQKREAFKTLVATIVIAVVLSLGILGLEIGLLELACGH